MSPGALYCHDKISPIVHFRCFFCWYRTSFEKKHCGLQVVKNDYLKIQHTVRIWTTCCHYFVQRVFWQTLQVTEPFVFSLAFWEDSHQRVVFWVWCCALPIYLILQSFAQTWFFLIPDLLKEQPNHGAPIFWCLHLLTTCLHLVPLFYPQMEYLQ